LALRPESARGLAHSKTLRAIRVPTGIRASVVDFRLRQTPARQDGGPPPLFSGARLWLKTQPQHVHNHVPPKFPRHYSLSSLLRLVLRTQSRSDANGIELRFGALVAK
jgi:hypothetical protein